jgi:hypothetical protein
MVTLSKKDIVKLLNRGSITLEIEDEYGNVVEEDLECDASLTDLIIDSNKNKKASVED